MIQKERLISLFKRLVEIDNPSRGERKICDSIIQVLKENQIVPKEDDSAEKIGGTAGNLYAYIEGSLDLPPILFSAHMDTVEPSCGKKALISQEGIITSEGATVLGADNISGISVILEALSALKESGLPHRPIEILFDVSEETYCTGISNFNFTNIRSKEGYVLDLDGPVGRAAYQAPSILSFRAEFHGKATHAAFSPEHGIHGIKAAAKAISRIECGKVNNTIVNIGTITGGIADNIVPDSCTITGEVRSFSHKDASRQLLIIERAVKRGAEEFGATWDFTSNTLCIAYCVAPEQLVAKRFKNVCASLGLQPRLEQTFGGSVNNHFVLHGMNGIVIAPGMNSCHSLNEYTTVEELERAANLTLSLMLSKE